MEYPQPRMMRFSANVGEHMATNIWSLGEATDIIVYIRNLPSYNSRLRSSDGIPSVKVKSGC